MSLSMVDIKENDILAMSFDLLNALLKDYTKSTPEKQENIFWGTEDYAEYGEGYQYFDPITVESITGKHGMIIVPRSLKSQKQQRQRILDKGEVFTPSWICNLQNNFLDEAWFGRKDVFNLCHEDHSWSPHPEKITFPQGKDWQDYVRETRMEITCGEAPYATSRYDSVTGQAIPLPMRIGLLDRKLRIISENTETSKEWLKWTKVAYQSLYGYEWQGDNLLLARENLLMTFSDYYQEKFHRKPQKKSLLYIAKVISCNFLQMDGLKGTIPCSCHKRVHTQKDLFGEIVETVQNCEGCQEGNIRCHNGIYCYIRDWSKKSEHRIRFIELLHS